MSMSDAARIKGAPHLQRAALSDDGIDADVVRSVVEWALPEAPGASSALISSPATQADIAQLISIIGERWPSTVAARYWAELDAAASMVVSAEAAEERAQALLHALLQDGRWRQAWAIAAITALTAGTTLAPGAGLSIENARSVLNNPFTFTHCRMERLGMSDARSIESFQELYRLPVRLDESPFGEARVRTVLRAIDDVVAGQEAAPGRLDGILTDLERTRPAMARIIQRHTQAWPEQARRQFFHPRSGTALTSLLNALAEQAHARQDYETTRQLATLATIAGSRYGRTVDWIGATEKSYVYESDLFPGRYDAGLIIGLEHLRFAVNWLADPFYEAVVHTGLGLLLRRGAGRGLQGQIAAVEYLERAIIGWRQVGLDLQAAGSEVDLGQLFIRLGQQESDLPDDVPEGVRNWAQSAEALLADAMRQLEPRMDDPVALQYLGEAYHNRAGLHQLLEQPHAVRLYASRGLDIARVIGHQDLIARLSLMLSNVEHDPERALGHATAAAEIVQGIRRAIQNEDAVVAWVTNKTPVFDAQLTQILQEAGNGLSEMHACELIVTALETGRGLTYNRWLSVEPVTRLDAMLQALSRTDPSAVIAVYAVTRETLGIVVLQHGAPPRLLSVPIPGPHLYRLIDAHLAGLRRQGALPGMQMWNSLQAGFLADGWRLIAPLEPYIAAGRTLCLVPHRALHGTALHTLPTAPGGLPIGLRTPVYQNPSLTNWMLASTATAGNDRTAFVGLTGPAAELRHFGEAELVARQLAKAGLHVVAPAPAETSIEALRPPNVEWRVFHLSSHGVFNEQGDQIGLLLASGGRLPPAPAEYRGKLHGRHLTVPAELREAGVRSRLCFLASCLSARNREDPGDDLLGVTRAIFAGGTGALVAGAWTVVSDAVPPFVSAFYAALGQGSSTASAMHQARQAVAERFPDPFIWGAFTHQGADTRVLQDVMPHE